MKKAISCRKLIYVCLVFSLCLSLPELNAQGPKPELYYHPATELPWAACHIHMGGGTQTKIPFLPVVLGRYQQSPLGTGNYTKDVAVDAPLVFVANGIFKEKDWNCYRGRRRDYTTGDIDVAGKAVVFCYDFPDEIEEKLKAEFPLEKRILEAARRKASAVILFSFQEDYPFLYAFFSKESEIPDIPVITITKSSLHNLFLGNFAIDDAAMIQKWKESRLPPEAVELEAKVRLKIQGAFACVETKNFLFRSPQAEMSKTELEAIAALNEKALDLLLACFKDGPGLTWKKNLVVYFCDYDTKYFYTHLLGRGNAREGGVFNIHSGGVPDLGLAAHENTHILIEENWGESSSFMSEGLGRYAEAMATDKDKNNRSVVQFLRRGELFPLEEMLWFMIGTGGLKTMVGYPASGSFIDFLIQSYGFKALKEAYQLEGRPAEAREKEDTWRKVYQRSIQDLEEQWLDWLKTKFNLEEKPISDHLKKSAVLKPVKTIDPKILEGLAGQYAGSGGIVLNVLNKNNRLFLEVPNMGEMALEPESESKFSIKGLDATLAFVRDERGKIDEIVFHTAAGDMTAKRIR
jgi:hypothetical protein